MRVERQKATRSLKRLHKQLADSNDESEKAEKLRSVHNAEVDLNYTLYYPLLKTYVALYPKQQKEDGKEHTAPLNDGPKGNVEMWKMVEKAMEEQTLDELRESKEGVKIPGAPDRSQAKLVKKDERKAKEGDSKARKSERIDATMQDEAEESDEGFFA